MKRDSFVFYRSFWESIKDLPRDIQGEVLTAIIEYGLNGATTENPKPIAGAILTLIKPIIDANNKRFENGSKGGRPKGKQNQTETETKPKRNQNETKQEPNVNVDVNVNEDVDVNNKLPNKFFFVQIKNLSEATKIFQGNKAHLFIAYRFWELWYNKNPNNQTMIKADANTWSNEVRKMLTYDGVTDERLIGIYTYFSECAKGKSGFRTFWFDTIKSIAGLRKKNKLGEFYIDRIIEEVNQCISIDDEFGNLVFSNIEKYKKYAKS